MPDREQVARSLRRSLHRLTAAVVVMVVAVLGVGWFTFSANQTAVNALCSLRTDLQLRVQSSEQVLTLHPRGLLGFSPALIRQQIGQQKQTIASLQGLSC